MKSRLTSCVISSPVFPSCAAILFALAAVEAMAYGWMHPPPAGLGQPVLCYRPQMKNRGPKPPDLPPSHTDNRQPTTDNRQQTTDNRQQTTDNRQQTTDNRQQTTDNRQPTTDPAPSTTYTPLPEIVAKSLPTLHGSTGTAARIDRDDGATIHVAFFEWELADCSSVLEAYKHLPEQCMGAIGLSLTAHMPPRFFQVGSESIAFDHTVFRDRSGTIVHAFKGTWVSGASKLLGRGLRGGAEQARRLRWTAALKRFRPAHARVAQGAVRGIPNPDLAWQAFGDAMLVNLLFN